MSFRITGLDPAPFLPLYGLSDADLAAHGAIRTLADTKPGFPDRIEMREGEPGEAFLLLNHVCQPAATPYRATHAILVREGATIPYDRIGEIPEVMRLLLLSLRAYDAAGMMLDADVTEGAGLEPLIARLLANPDVVTLHAHNARRGCYSGRIERA